MSGWPERFADCLGALCLLGSFTGADSQTATDSTFSFNSQIRSGLKVGLENCCQGEALHVFKGL